MPRNDDSMQMTQELDGVVQRMRELRHAEKHGEAETVADDAYTSLLGLKPELVDGLDAATLWRLVHDWQRVQVLATLMQAKAGVLFDSGRTASAERLRGQGLELMLEGKRQGETMNDHALELLASLR